MKRETPRCQICGTAHGPGFCARFDHFVSMIAHLEARDREITKRGNHMTQLAFAVDDLLANAASPKYRAQAIAKLRRIRKRFANL